LNLTCIPGMPTSISIKLGALNQEADAQEPIGREAGRGSEEKRSPTDAEKD